MFKPSVSSAAAIEVAAFNRGNTVLKYLPTFYSEAYIAGHGFGKWGEWPIFEYNYKAS